MNYIDDHLKKDLEYRIENQLLINQLNIVQEYLEESILNNNSKEQLQTVELKCQALERSNQFLKLENELLSNQLTFLQENINDINSFSVDGVSKGKDVREHLSYKLGFVLVSHSKSLKGWLTMPIALYREIRKFKTRTKKVS